MSDEHPPTPPTSTGTAPADAAKPDSGPGAHVEARVAARGAVTGVELARGLGHQPAKGFWAETWSSTLKRPLAIAGISWVALVAVLALLAPLIASGHPLIMIEPAKLTAAAGATDPDAASPTIASGLSSALAAAPAASYAWLIGGLLASLAWAGVIGRKALDLSPIAAIGSAALIALIGVNGFVMAAIDAKDGVSAPLWENLTGIEVTSFVAALAALVVFAAPGSVSRGGRFWPAVMALVQAVGIVAISNGVAAWLGRRDVEPWVRQIDQSELTPIVTVLVLGGLSVALFSFIQPLKKARTRLAIALIGAAVGSAVAFDRWDPPFASFNYVQRQAMGEVEAVYTLVPFSPTQTNPSLDSLPPMTTLGEGLGEPEGGVRVPAELAPTLFVAGTDSFGRDVLSQLLHACRLAVSIGLVSTGIAVTIGITMGALMGYFGGWVDTLLYRVVEIFMSTPRLLLLIVAAAVLPRSTYVMMIVIGAVTWTGAARFTRAEFFKLRDQDFVQAARAAGLPLPSILFKHMLPNGVTPVLVDASFQVAAAILIEAILSFLGLGPADQASWGRLLQDAKGETGLFNWWLAIFPGGAIFLTVLSYNLIGEALRDAIDPKLKKARV